MIKKTRSGKTLRDPDPKVPDPDPVKALKDEFGHVR
jgi:hypothetical protein